MMTSRWTGFLTALRLARKAFEPAPMPKVPKPDFTALAIAEYDRERLKWPQFNPHDFDWSVGPTQFPIRRLYLPMYLACRDGLQPHMRPDRLGGWVCFSDGKRDGYPCRWLASGRTWREAYDSWHRMTQHLRDSERDRAAAALGAAMGGAMAGTLR